ncbi:MAG: VIT1/CCC1 transporter family protein [Verrucomicrobia bacterium]|nr:VIT1/CCC1 transporter family protein [Verrucomicrobiota bacterium]
MPRSPRHVPAPYPNFAIMTNHFQGKPPLEHLKEARAKGVIAMSEVHGTEAPGPLAAGADGAKETAFVLFLMWILLGDISTPIFLLFSVGFLLWKIGRSALLGWSRLERLHRIIEEERWEIEHNRPQEREELTALYQAKGLQGKLLDETVSVLMADDNRLLQIMLEEEMGLTLEVFEHPLKQSMGAAIGVLTSAALFVASMLLWPLAGPIIMAGFIVALAAGLMARSQKNRLLEAITWNLSLLSFASGAVYFLKQII